jgi:hypothetical protein
LKRGLHCGLILSSWALTKQNIFNPSLIDPMNSLLRRTTASDPTYGRDKERSEKDRKEETQSGDTATLRKSHRPISAVSEYKVEVIFTSTFS